MDKGWDILGIGTATVDDFLVVDRFPAPDTKQEVLSFDRQGGGLIATALVAAARLGVRCAYAHILGEDELSRWIEADLQREGIDVSLLDHHPDVQAIHAVVIVAGQTRTILYTAANQQKYAPDYPPQDIIRAARVLLIDDVNQANIPNMLRITRTAWSAGIPIIADFEKTPHEELLRIVDHLIVSAQYAGQVTGKSEPAQTLRHLWHDQRSAVVVTDGANGCWYMSKRGEPSHQPAFEVDVVDTTGCGDVFHGAYAAALTWGWSLERRVRFASACAALKATQLGGRKGIPTFEEVEAYFAAV